MRYSGFLGIVEQTEVKPGVWEETVTEIPVLGDLMQRTETLIMGDQILPGYGTNMSVSVHARGIGPRDNSSIRYVTHAGVRWEIRSIIEQPPRIVLYFGEEYHGPTPGGAPDGP